VSPPIASFVFLGLLNTGSLAILNVCSAPTSELKKFLSDWTNAEIVERKDLRPRELSGTLRRLRKKKLTSLLLYCKDVSRQHNLFALKLISLAAGAREISFVDSTGGTISVNALPFLMRDLPLFILGAAYMVGVSFAFAALVLGLLLITRRRRAIAPLTKEGPISLCYLKTDFWFGLKAGGSVTHTQEFIKAAALSGLEVAVLAADPLTEYRLPVPVHLIPPLQKLFDFPPVISQIEYNIRFTMAVLRILRGRRPSLFYQRASYSNLSGVLLSRILRVPFVLECNNMTLWSRLIGSHGKGSLLQALCGRINLVGADRVAVVSKEVAGQVALAGVPQRLVILNPNGVDPETFRPDLTPMPLVFHGSHDPVVVGFIGIFAQYHGVLTLASSVRMVCEQEPGAHFVLLGDGELKEKMIDILRRDGVLEAVSFLGVVAHDDAPRYLSRCDILVSPHEDMADGARFFGSPTKIFEYMAMGKGIVATGAGQLGEILTDGRNAILVDQRDPCSLARGIVRLIRYPELRKCLGGAARQLAVDNYTWKSNCRRVVESLKGPSTL
jgi:glycosyltransferase involved in cell wall biosynthesis